MGKHSRHEVTSWTIVFKQHPKFFFIWLAVCLLPIIYYTVLLFKNPDYGFYIFPLVGFPLFVSIIFILVFNTQLITLCLAVFFTFYIGKKFSRLFKNRMKFSEKIFKEEVRLYRLIRENREELSLIFVSIKEKAINAFKVLLKQIFNVIYITILFVSTYKIIEIVFSFIQFYSDSQKIEAIKVKISSLHNLPKEVEKALNWHLNDQITILYESYISLNTIGLISLFFVCGISITILNNLNKKSKHLKRLKKIWMTFLKFWGYVIPLLATIVGLVITIKAG